MSATILDGEIRAIFVGGDGSQTWFVTVDLDDRRIVITTRSEAEATALVRRFSEQAPPQRIRITATSWHSLRKRGKRR